MAVEDTPDFTSGWCEIIERAWEDKEFKDRLQAEPDVVLAEAGFPPPEGMHFVVLQNAPRQLILVLPANPEEVNQIEPGRAEDVSRYYARCV